MTSRETAELRYIGDGLQSAASRMAEWIRKTGSEPPYEVYLAACEAEDYIAQWTDARTGYALEGPAPTAQSATASGVRGGQDGPLGSSHESEGTK